MGKRKRATKPPPKKKMPKLEKVFNCPFCGHEESVECKISKSENIGRIECRLCGVRYSTTIGRLEEEIDVYYKWIDACDAANRAPGAQVAEEEEEVAVAVAGKNAQTADEEDEEEDGDTVTGGKEASKVVVYDDDVDDEGV